ncbi:unnamed protein product, partial [Allacma fusca]
QEEGHSDWVSCVRFSPNIAQPIIVSCGWDKSVKVWNLANCKLKATHCQHKVIDIKVDLFNSGVEVLACKVGLTE